MALRAHFGAQSGGVGGRERTPHLIGRDDSWRRLSAALERVTPAEGALVLVSGEAGIGKTRLLEEFAAREPGALVARGGCVAGVPYAPWSDALWWLLDTVGNAVIGELPGYAGPQLARLIPSLTAVDLTGTTAEDGQQLLFDAVVDLLRHIARGRRLVVVIDDMHWIDPASRDLLRYVASKLRRIPMLLIPAFRPEDSTTERDLVAQLGRLAADRVVLERLPADRTTEIASILLGDAAAAADLDRITRASDGNPLFIEELAAAAGSKGIPTTLRDLMLERFMSLDDDARHLVSVAAVIGARSPRAWLVYASGLEADRARVAARASADAGVLVAEQGAYEFRHALLRQAVLDELLPDELVELHRAAAQALEQHPEAAAGLDRIAELARHWDAAQVPELALPRLVTAAKHARETYAYEAAVADYERALVWWDAVADPVVVAGVDRATVLLRAADAARDAGFVERAGELAWSAIDEAFDLGVDRGVEAAGRAWTYLWGANRSYELSALAQQRVLPVLDRVEPQSRARFLVGYVHHLVTNATPKETRGPATEMIATLDLVDDPVLEARGHMVNAWCHEAYGEFDRVEAEYTRAADLARRADAHATLVAILANHAASKQWTPDFEGSIELLDAADALIERYGLSRYRVLVNAMRNVALCLVGELAAARETVDAFDELDLGGIDRWTLGTCRARVALAAGDYDAAFAELSSLSDDELEDQESIIDRITMRADALAWLGNLDAARDAVDQGQRALEEHREAYFHGFFALSAMRCEGDAAAAASAAGSLDQLEAAHERGRAVVASWYTTVSELQGSAGIVEAFSLGIEAERARLANESAAEAATRAADQFEACTMRYHATYFRWRVAEAMLGAGERVAATDVLKRARAVALEWGFGGLEAAMNRLARTHQLRLGPARTNVDGDTALSVRELEVLHLLVDGRSNPEIAEDLFVSRRTAAAHVSNILRKLDAASRVEAVSEALRRGYV